MRLKLIKTANIQHTCTKCHDTIKPGWPVYKNGLKKYDVGCVMRLQEFSFIRTLKRVEDLDKLLLKVWAIKSTYKQRPCSYCAKEIPKKSSAYTNGHKFYCSPCAEYLHQNSLIQFIKTKGVGEFAY